MTKIKTLIENNFSALLILGFILGFFVPSIGEASDEVVIILTAFLIFLSCADIEPRDFLKVDIFQMGVFTLLRFAVFPLVLFYFAQMMFPDLAVGILLLALMPAGVAVGSLCSMSKANVSLGLSLTIITSLLAPAFVPSVFSFLGQVVNVDIFSLFMTLALVVFVPILLYFGIIYRQDKIKNVVQSYNKSSSVVILSVILLIVIAAQKEEFLSNIDTLIIAFFVMVGLFTMFYAFGIIFSMWLPKADRVPYIYSSGAMNNSLAVGLAFAYFSPTITLFIVLSEIVWSIYVAAAQWYFSKQVSSE